LLGGSVCLLGTGRGGLVGGLVGDFVGFGRDWDLEGAAFRDREERTEMGSSVCCCLGRSGVWGWSLTCCLGNTGALGCSWTKGLISKNDDVVGTER